MRTYPKLRPQEDDLKTATSPNFIGGVNKFVTDTHIQDNELSDALNMELTEDGVASKRRGSLLKLTQGSKIVGSTPFYPSSGTKYLIFTSGQGLYKSTDLVTATLIGSATQYTANLRTNYAQYNDFLYISNGTDNLTKTDGSTITTFTQVNAPTVALTMSGVGSTGGTTSYSYKYSWVTATGETTAGGTVTTTTGQNTLNATNNIALALNTTTPANTVGINIYGRLSGKESYMTFVAFPAGTAVNATVFTDTGNFDSTNNPTGTTPSQFFGVPLGNSSGGQRGKYVRIYRDSLFIAGDPSAKTRLYFSGGGDKIDSFVVSDGGGFIEVNRNGLDGTITGLEVWQDKMIVTKERSIYQFTFTATGAPSLAVVQPLHGCVDQRTLVAVENDLMMLSQISGKLAMMTLGFEPNFFNIIRTNQISIKISPLFDGVNFSQFQNAAAVYYDFKYILSLAEGTSATNNVCFVFDRRYNAHLGRWDSLTANTFSKFIDTTGKEILLYGADNSGKIVQLLTGADDQGAAISFSITTKNYNYGAFYVSKWFQDSFFQLRNFAGLISISTILEDNTGGSSSLSAATVNQNTGTIGWGTGNGWGNGSVWGNSSGSSSSTTSTSLAIRHNLGRPGRGVKFTITNSRLGDSVGIMAVAVRARIFSPYFFPSSQTV